MINICRLNKIFNFTHGLLYTFVTHDNVEFYLYHRSGAECDFQRITDPNISCSPKSRIVVINSSSITMVISCFPRLTSLFICPECGDNGIYDEYTFEHMNTMTSFQWPDRPNLERNIHQQISHRVFSAGYAQRLCEQSNQEPPESKQLSNISDLFFGQPTFDIHLIRLIFDHVA